METLRVNEETVDGNYVVEMYNPLKKRWDYITTEFSVSVATTVAINIGNATKQPCRVLSRRSKNMVLAEV